MIQDSGSRRKFETGAVRDVTEEKEKRRKARVRKDERLSFTKVKYPSKVIGVR